MTLRPASVAEAVLLRHPWPRLMPPSVGEGPARLLVAFVQHPEALGGLDVVNPLVVPPERFRVGLMRADMFCAAGILESDAAKALLGNAGRAATTRSVATALKLQSLTGDVRA
jgi:hypothetical protein